MRGLNEITMRPKYSRQSSTQRYKRNDTERNELFSIAIAVKLLIVVVFLSAFALCKEANTPATNAFIEKVNVVTTTNYDTNKYIESMVSALGINLPEKGSSTLNQSSQEQIDSSNNAEAIDNSATLGNDIQSPSADNNTIDGGAIADSSSVTNAASVETLDDSEIKAIADKYSFITPIKGEYVSLFGTRTDTLTGKSDFHCGLDISANMGTSIKAALAGEVIEVGSKPEYGNYIKIKHNDGIITVYAYCSTLIAKKGQKVNQGDVIAKVGDTEGMSGSLHFEVWKDNKVVDPEKLLNYLNQ